MSTNCEVASCAFASLDKAAAPIAAAKAALAAIFFF